jgi:hypothetical protein
MVGFTNDPIYSKGNISVQRIGGSSMWNVAINKKSVGRVLNAFTKEQAFSKAQKEKFANGGLVSKSNYYIILKKGLTITNESYSDELYFDTFKTGIQYTNWGITAEQYKKLKNNDTITIKGSNVSWSWKFKVTRDMVESIREIKTNNVEFDNGGNVVEKIPNNYLKKSPIEIWNTWSIDQRKHFLDDHSNYIDRLINNDTSIKKGISISTIYNPYISSKQKYISLNKNVKQAIKDHIKEGQYEDGGLIRKAPFKVGDMVYSYQNPNHKMRVAFVEDRGIEDGVDYGWGIRVALKTDANGNYDPNGSYSKTSKYMSQNSVSKTKKDSYSTGGMVEFYDYKGIEIMYEPNEKEYYANDMVFYSLEDAHEYIDSGEANKTPKHIVELYRRGMMAKGGNVGSQDLYKLAEEMSEKDFRNKFLTLSKSEKDNVESLIRLGDDKKLALITILDKRNEPNNDDFYRQAYHYKAGGDVEDEKVYIDYMNKEKGFKRDRIYFDSYAEAVEWGKKNFERFNTDMINYV